jgi:hypothetical protein
MERIKKVPKVKDCYNTTIMLSQDTYEIFRAVQTIRSTEAITKMCLDIDNVEKPMADKRSRTVRFQLRAGNNCRCNLGNLIERNIRDLADMLMVIG